MDKILILFTMEGCPYCEMMKEQLDDIQGTTEALENSYVKRLSNDKTLTKQDFLEYMEGLSFDVKKNSLGEQTLVQPPLAIPQDMTASNK